MYLLSLDQRHLGHHTHRERMQKPSNGSAVGLTCSVAGLALVGNQSRVADSA